VIVYVVLESSLFWANYSVQRSPTECGVSVLNAIVGPDPLGAFAPKETCHRLVAGVNVSE